MCSILLKDELLTMAETMQVVSNISWLFMLVVVKILLVPVINEISVVGVVIVVIELVEVTFEETIVVSGPLIDYQSLPCQFMIFNLVV